MKNNKVEAQSSNTVRAKGEERRAKGDQSGRRHKPHTLEWERAEGGGNAGAGKRRRGGC